MPCTRHMDQNVKNVDIITKSSNKLDTPNKIMDTVNGSKPQPLEENVIRIQL